MRILKIYIFNNEETKGERPHRGCHSGSIYNKSTSFEEILLFLKCNLNWNMGKNASEMKL